MAFPLGKIQNGKINFGMSSPEVEAGSLITITLLRPVCVNYKL